jgi:hypothetical protein
MACGDLSRADIPIRREMGASATLQKKIETKALSIDLHPKKVKALTTCIEIVRPFGGVEFCLLSVKESIKDVLLILLGDPNAKIPNLEKKLLIFLF